jgi:hypothetical protein
VGLVETARATINSRNVGVLLGVTVGYWDSSTLLRSS